MIHRYIAIRNFTIRYNSALLYIDTVNLRGVAQGLQLCLTLLLAACNDITR